MSSLPQGDPARQAELFQAAKDAADLTPTTSNKLRYALALATPGYSGSDPVAAPRQLSELLAQSLKLSCHLNARGLGRTCKEVEQEADTSRPKTSACAMMQH